MRTARACRILTLGAFVGVAGCQDSTAPARPVSITVTSGDGQQAAAGTILALPLVVTVTGSDNLGFAGATVNWSVTGGSGTVSPTSSLTDAAGRASTTLTLGLAFGTVTVTASTPGLTSQTFTATALDPCTVIVPHSLGGSSTGELSPPDCRLTDGSYIDYYSLTTTGQQAIRFTHTSSAFDAFLFLFGSTGDVLAVDDDGGTGLNSALSVILPAGSYRLGANSYAAGETGPYTLASGTVAESATGCLEMWVAAGIQSGQVLSSGDCISSGFYGDVFTIILRAGQAVTVGMASTDFDTYLGLVNSSGTVVAEDDDSGSGTDALLTYTATLGGIYYVVATSFLAGASGVYILTIQ